ncbi:MAG: ATP-dependent metallopeptidase FtsH/Yme1/Tma family protein [Rhodomicrobiaceae bacterium]
MADTVQQHHCTVPWWRRPPVLLLGIALVALVIFAIVETARAPAATPYGTFLDQLEAGNIASVTFKGTEIDGRFKHSISNASNGTAQTNTFRSRVPDFGDPSLIPELRKQHVAIDIVSSSSWTRLFASIPLPMLLFLGFIVVATIIRFMRGGKTQSDSAIPTHPMQGMIGLISGQFGKQQQAASPPTHNGGGPKSS